MNLINEDRNEFELLIETLDDLWILSQFISSGDIIYSKTKRKIKIERGNNSKTVTKIIYIDLLTKRVKFENEKLKVSGNIQNETEFTAVNSFHTLNFGIGDKIKLKKAELLNFQKKLLKNSISAKKSHNLFILLDRDELIASEFTDFSYKILFHKKNLGNKKQYKTNYDNDEQKLDIIKNLLQKDYSNIILAGPGIYKDKLQKKIKDVLNIKTNIVSWGDVSTTSIQKAIKEINKDFVSNIQILKEQEFVDELLKNINKNTKAVYGLASTFSKINEGNCKVLIITTKMLDVAKDEKKYDKINEYIKTVENLNGDLIIVDSKNEPGQIIDGLGGIAGILRY